MKLRSFIADCFAKSLQNPVVDFNMVFTKLIWEGRAPSRPRWGEPSRRAAAALIRGGGLPRPQIPSGPPRPPHWPLATLELATFPHWQHFHTLRRGLGGASRPGEPRPRHGRAALRRGRQVGRAVPASRGRPLHWPLATLELATLPHWQHSHIGNISTTPRNSFHLVETSPCPVPIFLVLYAQHTRRTACPIRRGMSIKGAFFFYGTNHSQAQLSQDVDRP